MSVGVPSLGCACVGTALWSNAIDAADNERIPAVLVVAFMKMTIGRTEDQLQGKYVL